MIVNLPSRAELLNWVNNLTNVLAFLFRPTSKSSKPSQMPSSSVRFLTKSTLRPSISTSSREMPRVPLTRKRISDCCSMLWASSTSVWPSMYVFHYSLDHGPRQWKSHRHPWTPSMDVQRIQKALWKERKKWWKRKQNGLAQNDQILCWKYCCPTPDESP